jgi:Bacterial Ig-like domain
MRTLQHWLLIVLLGLMACTDPSSAVTVNIAQPATNLATNTNVAVKLEIPNFNPDQFSTLTVVIERKKTTDPDTNYAPLKVFEKTDPYPFAFTWNPTNEPDGAYTLRARATYQLSGFGGSSATSSTTRSITLDRQAPSITDRTPTPDAKDVSVRAPIRVTFSEPIAAGSPTDDSVKVMSGNAILARKLERSSDGKTLTITPSSAPVAPATVSVTISEAITDTVGNKMVGATSWNWNAPAWVRLGELRSSVSGVQSVISASFAVGSDGHPVAVWRGSSDGGLTIDLYVSRWAGTKWVALGGNLRSLVSGKYVSSGESICLDANGTPFVAWRGNKDTNGIDDVFVYRWDGINWQPVGAGLRETRRGLYNVYINGSTLDSSGFPVISWVADTNNPLSERPDRAAFLSRWDGTKWQVLGDDLRTLIPSTKFAEFVTPFVGGSKDVLAFWSATDSIGIPVDTFLYRWTGTSWEPVISSLRAVFSVPASVLSGGSLKGITLTPDAGKALVIASNEGSNIRVQKATATGWIPMGGLLNEALPPQYQPLSSPLAFNATGNLIAAVNWRDAGTPALGDKIGVSLLSFDGATWHALENAPMTSGVGSAFFQALLRSGPDATLYISWPEQAATGELNITIYQENR